MDVVEQMGLLVGYVDAEQALAQHWRRRASELDLIRVNQPERVRWPDLEAGGFHIKPAWLTWLRQMPESEEQFLRELPRDARASFRKGQEYCRSTDIDLEAHRPPSPAIVDRFLAIYARIVAGMERGVQFANSSRDTLLAQLADMLIILATRDGEILGGALCEIRRAESMLYLRYQITFGEARRNGLGRALDLRASQFARSEGLQILSLGRDPNLYGHISRTGLFYAKHRLSFRPFPSQLLAAGHDEADLILRLGCLADPSMMVCYDWRRPPERVRLGGRQLDAPAFRVELFCHEPLASTKMYRAGFITDVCAHPTALAKEGGSTGERADTRSGPPDQGRLATVVRYQDAGNG